jgi:hypothetical protein
VLAAVASLVCVVGLGTLSGATAAPAARLAAAPSGGHIPKQKGGSNAATLVDGTTTVKKAKTTITLPRVLLHAYANNKFKIKHKILYTTSPSWAVTHRGRHPRFGTFPVAHSAVLGFGAIPITASLHLTQVVHHGLIVPIVVRTKGQTVAPFKRFPAHVTGLVDVRISRVMVDEVPLHVGPNCHSATPMRLRLTGGKKYDLFQGGLLKGVVTIPPFVGCGTHGDNLDPLLNGTISGPGNRLRQIQGNLGGWDPSRPNDCKGCHPPND